MASSNTTPSGNLLTSKFIESIQHSSFNVYICEFGRRSQESLHLKAGWLEWADSFQSARGIYWL